MRLARHFAVQTTRICVGYQTISELLLHLKYNGSANKTQVRQKQNPARAVGSLLSRYREIIPVCTNEAADIPRTARCFANGA